VLRTDHLDTLATTNNLATMLARHGKVEVVEGMVQELLEKMERVLGPEHPFTLNCVHGLAVLLLRKGNHDEASKLSLQVLEGCVKVLGPSHHFTLIAANTASIAQSNTDWQSLPAAPATQDLL
jgi:hypothetical protein